MLVPIEHLHPAGLSDAFAAAVTAHGWSAAQVAFFDRAVALYWERSAQLARRIPGWPPPRLRHVAVVADPLAVHPYAALLNTSAWTLYAADLDPATSHPELAAYLLAHGDRLMLLGEVTTAALHHAAWWLERDDVECDAFAQAAARSPRPDAAALRALAAALPWLRRLGHAALRPCVAAHRTLAGTGVQVPRALEDEPPALIRAWTAAAQGAVAAYTRRWQPPDPRATAALLEWLAADAPPLLVVAHGAVIWDPETPGDLAPLRQALAPCSGAAVLDVHADLRVVAERTRQFLGALAARRRLPPASDAEQRGYVYMHRDRGLLAYALDEPGIDRRHGPALPFARAMLGARAVHEWAHRAVDAGCVPWSLPATEQDARLATVAALLDDAIAAASPSLRAATAADVAALAAAGRSAGAALARLLTDRMSDFQCNLLAQRFLDEAERETYVRHNIRTLRADYAPAQRWRMLTRYLYELQYLRFSAVADPRRFLLRSTWADADLIDAGLVTRARFDALADAVAALCDGYAVAL